MARARRPPGGGAPDAGSLSRLRWPDEANGRAPRRLVTLTGEVELLDRYRLVEALQRAIGDERADRPDQAVAAAGPGDAEGRLELLAGWSGEEAGADLARSDQFVAVWGYVANNWRGVSALVRLRLLRVKRTWDRYWAGRLAALLRRGP